MTKWWDVDAVIIAVLAALWVVGAIGAATVFALLVVLR